MREGTHMRHRVDPRLRRAHLKRTRPRPPIATGAATLAFVVAAAAAFALHWSRAQPAELEMAPAAAHVANHPMHEARDQHAAALLSDGRVLITGGVGYMHNKIPSSEIYKPSDGSWTPTASMAGPPSGPTAKIAGHWHRFVRRRGFGHPPGE